MFTDRPVRDDPRRVPEVPAVDGETNVHDNDHTLARELRRRGYETGYVGKWHLAGTQTDPVPEEKRTGYEYWRAADAMEFTTRPYEGVVYDEDGDHRTTAVRGVRQMTDENDDTGRENSPLEHGTLYWDTDSWKTYAPYREDDDLVYMVTVRKKSEIADAVETGLLVPHEERLADSQFDSVDAIDSFRHRPAEEVGALADSDGSRANDDRTEDARTQEARMDDARSESE